MCDINGRTKVLTLVLSWNVVCLFGLCQPPK